MISDQRLRTLYLSILGCLIAIGCGCDGKKANGQQKLRVAAASDLRFALEAVQDRFMRAHADAELEIVYGASGKLFAQIREGAPFDVFLSADKELVQRLLDEKRGAAGSEFTYARGHLVVWALKKHNWNVGQSVTDLLADPAVQKIALANPQHAPYGRAAEQALRHLGLYEQLEEKLVYGENVAQTMQFVESGAADLGIIGLSLARSPQLQEAGDYWPLPEDSYTPLDQAAVIVRRKGDTKLAQEFCDFLKSDSGQSILQQFGFSIPKEGDEN